MVALKYVNDPKIIKTNIAHGLLAVGTTANKRFICFLLNINLDLSKKTKKEEWYGKK
jgi:hypothetical protein